MKPPIYVLSSELNYQTFRKIWRAFPSEGITPECMIDGKPIWELLKEKKILVYCDPLCKDDPLTLAYKLPKNRKVSLLENPLKTKKKVGKTNKGIKARKTLN